MPGSTRTSRRGGDEEPAAGRSASPAPAAYVTAVALSILGALLLGFVVDVALVGRVRHARDQRTAYSRFRVELARGTAPVGPAAYGAPVAIVEIPVLGVREVVREGTTSSVLRAGPGHRRDTPLPGQAGTSVVFGRAAAYGGPFGDVVHLSAGDTIRVTTGQGVHAYRVRGLRRAGDLAPPPLAAGQGRLTLVTADGGAYVPAGVLRVDADLTSPVQPAPRRGAVALLPSERPLAGDRGALVPLVLLGQALLAAALAFVWLRSRWGRRQAWVAGVPVLLALGVATADTAARLLPNLL